MLKNFKDRALLLAWPDKDGILLLSCDTELIKK